MTFYIFKCSKDGSLFGATDEPTGAKLPPNACPGGKWKPVKSLKGSAIGFDAKAAEKDIKKQGYHLFRAEIKITATVLKNPKKKKS